LTKGGTNKSRLQDYLNPDENNGYEEEDMENGDRDPNNEISINAHQRAKALKVKQKAGSGKPGMNSDYE
jgi:hypothetical protein